MNLETQLKFKKINKLRMKKGAETKKRKCDERCQVPVVDEMEVKTAYHRCMYTSSAAEDPRTCEN